MKHWLKYLVWPLSTIDSVLPRTGTIIDLGCGDGLVAHYLARRAPARYVIGLDSNSTKITQARAIKPKLPNLKFITRDIIHADLSPASGCILSDVLHHLSPSSQIQLLDQLASQLKPHAVCVIKEINRDDFIRANLTRLWDWLLYPHDKIHYYSATTLIKLMRHRGFSVKFKPLLRFFPGSVNLFVCTKQ